MDGRLRTAIRRVTMLLMAGAVIAASPLTSADLARGMAAYDRGSFEEALRELNDPATASQPRAQFLLGLMYANGEGVGVDRAKAAQYLRQSQRGGFQPAGDALAALDLGGTSTHSSAAPMASPMSESATVRSLPKTMDSHGTLSGTQLQLGAFSNLTRAQKAWSEVRQRAPDYTSDLSADFPAANSGGRRIYRVRVGPFDGPRAARERCDDLIARGAVPECLVIR